MKKCLYVIATLASMLTATAQVPDSFTVTAPSWQEGALVVNNSAKTAKVYKTPSAQAAYFVYNPQKRQEWETAMDVGYWGTSTSKIRFVSPQGGCPVVEKTTGWVKMYGAGPKGADGWVQSKFTRLAPKVNITMDNVAADPDLCELYGMVFYLQYDTSEQTARVNIGKLVDGVLVFPYVVENMPVSVDNSVTPSVGENDDYYYLELTSNEMDNQGYPVISKFPSSVLAKLLDLAGQAEHPLALFSTQGGLLRVNLR